MFIVYQNVAAAGTFFDTADFFDQPAIGDMERSPGFNLHGNQPFANENVPALLRINHGKRYTPLFNQRQTEQQHLFKGQHLALFLLPVRLGIFLADEMSGLLLDPLRLDLRIHARKQLAGFHQFRRHQPAAVFPVQGRTGKHHVFSAACPQIRAIFQTVGHLTEKPAEYGAMHFFVGGWLAVELQLHFLALQQQLPVHLAPFAHAHP